MSVNAYTTEFQKAVNKVGLEAASLVHGAPEQRPRFLFDLEAKELIWGPPDKILTYDDFRDYQRWMGRTAAKQDVFLGAEMGLGKTAAALFAISVMLTTGYVNHVLIVAPLRVAEETWPEEIAKWDFARDLTYRVVTGNPEERKAALKYPAQITITNRENLYWLQSVLVGRKWVFDCLIYDEASRLKSGMIRVKPNKNKDVDFRKLTELGVLHRHRHKFKRVIELSGTPSPNGLIDLWGPIFLIDSGKRLGDSMTAYKRRWFREDKYGYGVEPFDHSEKEIMGKLDDVFYSLKESDYLDLPPLVERDVVVNMTPAEMRLYRSFIKEMAIEVVNNEGDPEIIRAMNQGVLTGKLLQFANGSLYLDDQSAKKIHEHKLDALGSIIEEASGRPILCAYSFQFDKAAIKKRFPFVRIYGETKNDMRDWNAGKIKFLLTHPASAGHGLNFQKGSNIAVWYGLTWSLELYLQFRKRLHRSGQQADKVFLYRIITKGTMDEKVLRALAGRGATQDRITDTVRLYLKRLAARA